MAACGEVGSSGSQAAGNSGAATSIRCSAMGGKSEGIQFVFRVLECTMKTTTSLNPFQVRPPSQASPVEKDYGLGKASASN